MPLQKELPQTIHELAYRNAVEVRAGPNYKSCVSRLGKGILARWNDTQDSRDCKREEEN